MPAEAVGAIPDELDAVDAPALCWHHHVQRAPTHGRRSEALVAVQGVGGLGHPGMQYGPAAGFETMALPRSPTRRT